MVPMGGPQAIMFSCEFAVCLALLASLSTLYPSPRQMHTGIDCGRTPALLLSAPNEGSVESMHDKAVSRPICVFALVNIHMFFV